MLVDEIIASIQDMRVVQFVYKRAWRTVEPHLLGVHSNGKLCLSAFQLSGGSDQAWRAFLVDEMSSFTPSDDHFDQPRPGFNPNDTTMERILASVV